MNVLFYRKNPKMFMNVTQARNCDKLCMESHRTASFSKIAYVMGPRIYNNLPKDVRLTSQ